MLRFNVVKFLFLLFTFLDIYSTLHSEASSYSLSVFAARVPRGDLLPSRGTRSETGHRNVGYAPRLTKRRVSVVDQVIYGFIRGNEASLSRSPDVDSVPVHNTINLKSQTVLVTGKDVSESENVVIEEDPLAEDEPAAEGSGEQEPSVKPETKVAEDAKPESVAITQVSGSVKKESHYQFIGREKSPMIILITTCGLVLALVGIAALLLSISCKRRKQADLGFVEENSFLDKLYKWAWVEKDSSKPPEAKSESTSKFSDDVTDSSFAVTEVPRRSSLPDLSASTISKLSLVPPFLPQSNRTNVTLPKEGWQCHWLMHIEDEERTDGIRGERKSGPIPTSMADQSFPERPPISQVPVIDSPAIHAPKAHLPPATPVKKDSPHSSDQSNNDYSSGADNFVSHQYYEDTGSQFAESTSTISVSLEMPYLDTGARKHVRIAKDGATSHREPVSRQEPPANIINYTLVPSSTSSLSLNLGSIGSEEEGVINISRNNAATPPPNAIPPNAILPPPPPGSVTVPSSDNVMLPLSELNSSNHADTNYYSLFETEEVTKLTVNLDSISSDDEGGDEHCDSSRNNVSSMDLKEFLSSRENKTNGRHRRLEGENFSLQNFLGRSYNDSESSLSESDYEYTVTHTPYYASSDGFDTAHLE